MRDGTNWVVVILLVLIAAKLGVFSGSALGLFIVVAIIIGLGVVWLAMGLVLNLWFAILPTEKARFFASVFLFVAATSYWFYIH